MFIPAIESWKKNRNKVPFLWFFSLFFILFVLLLAAVAYFISPDKTKNVNQGDLSIALKEPMFRAWVIAVPLENYKGRRNLIDYFFGHDIDKQHIISSAFRVDQSARKIYYTPYNGSSEKEIDFSIYLKRGVRAKQIHNFIEKRTWWLGTDALGRDLLSRLLVGSRISILVGFIAVLVSLGIGLPLGMVSGYYGGSIDKAVMWLVQVLWSIPTLILVMALTLAMEKGFWQIFIAVGLSMWVEVTRLIRGLFISLKEKEYVQAGRALGYTDFRIMFKHMLPHTFGSIMVVCAANFASAILIESGLSFLGIGAPPPAPSWGNIIKENYVYLLLGKVHLALIPGLCILLLTSAFMILSQGFQRLFLDQKG